MSTVPSNTKLTTVWHLAVNDLAHEWILTLCLVLALGAVIAPLMLLMGLKHGTIETLRDRLVQDPVNRRILPAKTQLHQDEWFSNYRDRADVAFLVPTILPAASVVSAILPGSKGTELMDLVPSGQGDPLLLENGGVIPQPGQCVLTRTAAKKLGVVVGDRVDVHATRIRRGRTEYGEASLTVSAILDARAGLKPRMFVPLQFVVDVEAYKEGMAVPSRGWPGGTRVPYQSYDGVLVILEKPLDDLELSALPVNTGLSTVVEISAADFQSRYGVKPSEGLYFYDLKVHSAPVQGSSYKAVKRKLRGQDAIIVPYAVGVRARFADGRSAPVAGISLPKEESEKLGIEILPWGKLDLRRPLSQIDELLFSQVSSDPESGERIDVTFLSDRGDLSLPIELIEGGGPVPLMPAELIGMLRTGLDRAISYSAEQDALELHRLGYRGFRMYARSIDDVAILEDDMRAHGIETITQAAAIERVRILDRGLSRIFWLVAIVGIVGGLAALVASLYASVQRKRRAIGIMRLLGIPREQVFMFPIYQALVIAAISIAVATSAYWVLANVINLVFASDLDLGQEICHLPAGHTLVGLAATLIVAAASSLYAAKQATSIDPAEALRDE